MAKQKYQKWLKVCGVLFLEINDKVKILMPSKKCTLSRL